MRENAAVIGCQKERSEKQQTMSETNINGVGVSPTVSVSRAACNSKGSMIVVSNRLPFILKRNEKTGELERKAR